MNWKNRRFRTKAAIRACGAILIMWSLAILIMLTNGFFVWYEAWRYFPPLLLVGIVTSIAEPGGPTGLGRVAIMGIIGTPVAVGLLGLMASTVYLFTGFGALRFRAWTRRMAIVLAVDVIAWYFFGLWIYGAQKLGIDSYLGMALQLAVLVSYSADRTIRAELNGNRRSPGRGPKALLVFYTGVVVLKLLSAPLFIGYLHTSHGDLIRALNAKPHKVRYEILDPDFLRKQCSRYDVFGYSVHLPRDLMISGAHRGTERGSWSLYLRSTSARRTSDAGPFVLHDRSEYAVSEIQGFFNLFGIENAYERDRKLSYPTWNPLCLSMKAIGGPFEIVEDVTTPGWRGFVKVSSRTWRDSVVTDVFHCTAYSLTDSSSANIIMSSARGSVIHSRMRDMMASLEFSAEAPRAVESYSRGTTALCDEKYTDAAIAFLRALYIDDRNPEYAYLFAKSLFEDPREALRKNRLSTGVSFLRYALELDSAYKEVRELLPIVEEEYQAMKERESE